MLEQLTDKFFCRGLRTFIAIAFIFAPLYTYQNQGWPSLALPYNTSAWIIFSWLISTGIFIISSRKVLIYPAIWPFVFFFPVIILLSSLFSNTNDPIDWLFRQLFILGGAAFLLALFQFDLSERQKDNLLYVFIVAAGCQALISFFQILSPDMLPSWLNKQPNSTVPRGTFQQVNVLASFLVTGLTICLYVISRPSFKSRSLWLKYFLILVFGLCVYVTIASGSRVGLLSLLTSLPIILLARWKHYSRQKYILVVLIVASIVGSIGGKGGFSKTVDKTLQMKDAQYSAARVSMYTIGLELVAKEPLSGYGIGSFLKTWNKQSADFFQRYPEANLPLVIEHPHNEILFWMIEGGLLALSGILLVFVGLMISIYKCGFERGAAYFSMLFPITLHTQVEHPMYTSSLHWFLWLFLVFLILRHRVKVKNISLSTGITRLINVFALVFSVFVTVSMIQIARAENELFNFVYYPEKQKPPYLQLALNNIYTKQMAEYKAMSANLYSSIESQNLEGVKLFEDWANQVILKKPYLFIYKDLIAASITLRPEGNGCDAILRAHQMYPHIKKLTISYEKCQLSN
ncbi:Wzy polymerase domain-containing protein [Methylophaga sp.]|uniref:PglL family O-oligosaccharyltransferase n=1 Tax=Methylophaga sp. TaxID=2024840 RepID=UPI003A8CE0FC